MRKNEGLMTIVVVTIVFFALTSVALSVGAAAEYECPADAQQAYQQYMAAFNRMASLMAEGKGDTPEAQEAYQEFAKAMACYESRLTDNSGGTSGFATIKDWDESGDSFSFSLGEVCSGCWHEAPDSDFFIADRAEDSIIHVFDSPGIIDMGNIPLDDIKEAPASGYVEMATPIMGHSYVVRSKGKYGKFYLDETYDWLDPTEYGIRWVYQLNGSRAFGGAEAPGEPATPGQTGTGGEYECPQDAGEAYQQYIAAYNKLTYLMAQGKGDTPEAQVAYEEYKAAKACYESRTSGFATFATIEDWDESGDTFSFSRGKVVSEGGDFFIADRGENSIIHVFDSPGIIDMGDIPLGDIKEAPESGYIGEAKPIEGHSYVMRSQGKYGKIRIEDLFSPEDYDGFSVTKYEFEWVYQPDGTRSFGGGEAPTPTPTPTVTPSRFSGTWKVEFNGTTYTPGGVSGEKGYWDLTVTQQDNLLTGNGTSVGYAPKGIHPKEITLELDGKIGRAQEIYIVLQTAELPEEVMMFALNQLETYSPTDEIIYFEVLDCIVDYPEGIEHYYKVVFIGQLTEGTIAGNYCGVQEIGQYKRMGSFTVTVTPGITPAPTPAPTPTKFNKCAGDEPYLYVEDRVMGKGKRVEIPIIMCNAKELASMDLDWSYNASVLKIINVTKGSLNEKALFNWNEVSPGKLKIAFASSKGVTGSGSIAVMKFEVIGNTGDTSTLTGTVTTAGKTDGTEISVSVNHGEFTVGTSQIKGDCDGDGELTVRDALVAIQMSVVKMAVDMCCDYNGDGKVDSSDAREILKAIGADQ